MNFELLSYLDYRLFLKEAYQKLKTENRHFSHRKIAMLTDTSVGYFMKIIQGKRNISGSVQTKLCELFKLNTEEIEYFNLLVNHNQAKNEEERNGYLKKILKAQDSFGKKVNSDEELFFDDYKNTLIKEATALLSENTDWEQLLKQFVFPISKDELNHHLEFLIKIGILEETKTGFKQTDRKVLSGEVNPEILKRLNDTWMELASQASHKLPKEERSLSFVSLSLSQKGETQLQELLYNTRKHMVAIAQNDRNVDRVIQVNLQSFPLIKPKE